MLCVRGVGEEVMGGARHLETKVAVAIVPVIDDGRVEGLCNETTHNNQPTHAHKHTQVPKEQQTAETHISMFLHNIKCLLADHWRGQTILWVLIVE